MCKYMVKNQLDFFFGEIWTIKRAQHAVYNNVVENGQKREKEPKLEGKSKNIVKEKFKMWFIYYTVLRLKPDH